MRGIQKKKKEREREKGNFGTKERKALIYTIIHPWTRPRILFISIIRSLDRIVDVLFHCN